MIPDWLHRRGTTSTGHRGMAVSGEATGPTRTWSTPALHAQGHGHPYLGQDVVDEHLGRGPTKGEVSVARGARRRVESMDNE